MGVIRWLCRALGKYYFPLVAWGFRGWNADVFARAGGEVTAMGVTADLIKVVQRVS